ncbi:MAG: hypothetical protein U0974_08925 [Gemmatimonadales bacterium]|nr:hypothetical protein [Gemmatimonadales bacterium]MDZ4389839.1 hypothetical protein [Gemmatimonadales bacterium]
MRTRFLSRSPLTSYPDSFLSEHAALLRKHLPLSPTQAIVAVGIWLSLPEKQIAAGLGKSSATIHQHTRAIYAQFGQLGFAGRVGVAVAVERVLGQFSPEMIVVDTDPKR